MNVPCLHKHALRRTFGTLALAFALILARHASAVDDVQSQPIAEVSAFTTPSLDLKIASEMNGIVDTVPVDEGAQVKAGDVLAQLKSEVLRADLAVTEAKITASDHEIDTAIADHALKNERCTRYAELFEKHVMSELQYAETRRDLEVARLSVENARIQKRIAELVAERDREALKRSIIRAPSAGIILRVLKHPGEAVSAQETAFQLVDVDPLWVIAFVPISAAQRIQHGQSCEMIIEDQLDTPFACTMDVVDKVADTASGTCRVRAILLNPGRTLPAGAKGLLRIPLAPIPPVTPK